MTESLGPLGTKATFPDAPDARVLFAVPRSKARALAQLTDAQLAPFGEDIFTAWEFSWRDLQGRPHMAVLRLVFDASSPMLIESKSLKLYLHGYAQQRFASDAEVIRLIAADLAPLSGGTPKVDLLKRQDPTLLVREAPERCIDEEWRDSPTDTGQEPSANILAIQRLQGTQAWISHSFGSLCPVTGQPDWASIRVRCEGHGPTPQSLLKYLAGFRRHQGFHEACADIIFAAISQTCRPTSLCVMAQFTRRGGIEIAPVRGSSSDLLHWVRLFRL